MHSVMLLFYIFPQYFSLWSLSSAASSQRWLSFWILVVPFLLVENHNGLLKLLPLSALMIGDARVAFWIYLVFIKQPFLQMENFIRWSSLMQRLNSVRGWNEDSRNRKRTTACSFIRRTNSISPKPCFSSLLFRRFLSWQLWKLFLKKWKYISYKLQTCLFAWNLYRSRRLFINASSAATTCNFSLSSTKESSKSSAIYSIYDNVQSKSQTVKPFREVYQLLSAILWWCTMLISKALLTASWNQI